MTRNRRIAAISTALVLASACSSDDDGPRAIEPTTEPTTETPEATDEPVEPDDPYAVPDQIDVEYVQRVIDATLAVPDEPLLEAYRTAPHPVAPPPVADALRATRTPEEAAAAFARHSSVMSNEDESADEVAYLESAPPLRWEILDVEVDRNDCVVLRFAYPEGADVPEGRAVLVANEDPERDPGGLNPTPWLIDRIGAADTTGVAELEERCSIDHFAEPEDPDADGGEADA